MTDPMSTRASGAGHVGEEPYPRRWLALAVIAVTVLLVILDATIVNIALPAVSADLQISAASQQWIVTAYTLTFGGFLLLGGRIADFWGRKRTYLVGAGGFAVASALGGIAQNEAMLFGARALQGAFGALLAPASLALLTVLFTDARERAKAFAVYGAIAGGGSAVGLLLGGVLTEYADWRWCFWVNLPVAIVAIVAAIPIVPESRAPGDTSYDIPGAVLVTAGIASFVYGFTQVAEKSQENAAAGSTDSGWTDPAALAFIVVGVVLVAAFVVLELRIRNPLLPMRIILDRNRGGAYLTSTLVGAGLIGAFFFLSLYFQQVLEYKPVHAGIASLPVTLGVLVSAGAASALVVKVGPKPLMVLGGLLAASGLFVLSFLAVDSGFWSLAFPGQVLLGLGLGFTFVPLSNLALVGAGAHDAGAASAVLNATQQVGASIGTALLATLSVGAITDYMTDVATSGGDPQDPAVALQAQVEGYTTAFTWAAALLVLGALVSAVLIKATKEDLPADSDAVVHVG
ncbi:MFS transporter [Geodermatophilus sabuli]|uniref:Drug resistance transporter, EmrB/QacA subfamily n=1 Tax=Geodermatophilus sabuli TaxID=1564158 RepID=A0A285E5H7_9ACTN|nr:MFS transporter [Geodermatophilus sabuli]MBB3082795.1 EmrB/QacA subfamily drug resistance transporter [Geodermatophilus sabuli]SNX94339.1 drug resistance transporter, EmrB/QacA subfamily [Geodermatophilus sabuli]